MIETLPSNPTILLSTVHTLLRDHEFDNLSDLCHYYDCRYGEMVHIVREDETAQVVGSGLLPVYATPSVVALMEQTACKVIDEMKSGSEGAPIEGDTTVGTRIVLDHVKACLAQTEVRCTAMLLAVEGRAYNFLIEVTNPGGEVLARAEHTRFCVSAERFMAKLR